MGSDESDGSDEIEVRREERAVRALIAIVVAAIALGIGASRDEFEIATAAIMATAFGLVVAILRRSVTVVPQARAGRTRRRISER